MSEVLEASLAARARPEPAGWSAHSPRSVEFVRLPGEFGANGWLRCLTLATFDLVGVALAAFAGLVASVGARELLGRAQPVEIITAPVLRAVFVVPAGVILWNSSKYGHYFRIKPFWTEARELVRMVAYSSAFAVGLTFVMKAYVSRIWLVSTLLALLLLAPSMRALAKGLLKRTGHWFAPLIVVGDRSLIEGGERAIASDHTLGYRVAVRIDASGLSGATEDVAPAELATALIKLAAMYGRPRLLLAFDHRDILEYQQSLVEAVSRHFEHVVVAKQMYGLPTLRAETLFVDKFDTVFFRFSPNGIARHEAAIKRAIDVIGACAALVLAAPVLLTLAWWVRLDGGSAFYGSERIGRSGRRFRCYKLRSMSADGDAILRAHLDADAAARAEWCATFKLKEDPRVTRVGRLIRKTSLDELPQFLNVLRGDMSLVGPRPILPDEIPGYGRSLSLYEGVRPGLTGLWQISGRSALAYADRVHLNKWYVRNWSLWLDVSILVRTLPAVLGSRDAV